MTGYQLVGGTFRTDLNEPDKQFEVGDGCEDIDECAVAPDGSIGTESGPSRQDMNLALSPCFILVIDHLCVEDSTCYNDDGSYHCECDRGYEGK